MFQDQDGHDREMGGMMEKENTNQSSKGPTILIHRRRIERRRRRWRYYDNVWTCDTVGSCNKNRRREPEKDWCWCAGRGSGRWCWCNQEIFEWEQDKPWVRRRSTTRYSRQYCSS